MTDNPDHPWSAQPLDGEGDEHERCKHCGERRFASDPHCMNCGEHWQAPERSACSCVHDARYHDPVSGACLYTNPTYGPCPCAATPASTRAALDAAHEKLQARLQHQSDRRSR